MTERLRSKGDLISKLEISPMSLDELVSWSDRGSVTLREYIAAKGHPKTAKAFGIDSIQSDVKDISELSEEETRQLVCAQIGQSSKDLRLGILGLRHEGAKTYSKDDLIREVQDPNSRLGQTVVSAHKMDTALVQRLAKKGQLYPRTRPDEAFKLPSGREVWLK